MDSERVPVPQLKEDPPLKLIDTALVSRFVCSTSVTDVMLVRDGSRWYFREVIVPPVTVVVVYPVYGTVACGAKVLPAVDAEIRRRATAARTRTMMILLDLRMNPLPWVLSGPPVPIP
jgi:hypothetical protein